MLNHPGASLRSSKLPRTRAHCSHTSVGLTQARPNKVGISLSKPQTRKYKSEGKYTKPHSSIHLKKLLENGDMFGMYSGLVC